MEQENKQQQIKMDDYDMKNQKLDLEIANLKDLNCLKNQEIDSKNEIFEIFVNELKEKFERMKEKVEEDQKIKEELINEQKEMLFKYKQVNLIFRISNIKIFLILIF